MTHEKFTEEALKAQDGKKVPFTRELGGPVIGEATMRYDSESGSLIADIRIDSTKVTGDILGETTSAVIFKKES
jgi:hypothetical protein